MAKRTSSTRKRSARRPSPPRRLKSKKSPRKPVRRARAKARAVKKPAKPKIAAKRTRPAKAAPVAPPKARRRAKPAKVAALAKSHPHDPHPPTLARERRRLPDSERGSGATEADGR